MAQVKVSETVAAPADAVWGILRDFGGVAKWGGPALQQCQVEGSGVGAVRRITGPGGLQIVERLEAFDDAGRSLSYSIIEKSPIPVKGYLSTVKVTPEGDAACRVDWSSTFEPDGAPAETGEKIVRQVYTGGIAGIRKALGV
jgi:carbon monoxide dehydrogenase subunit G